MSCWDESECNADVVKKGKADQFLMGADSSDEDSDEGDKTVVLSAKDKRFVEMDAAIQNIKNATKGEGAANDWVVAASGKLLLRGQRQVLISQNLKSYSDSSPVIRPQWYHHLSLPPVIFLLNSSKLSSTSMPVSPRPSPPRRVPRKR
jgi:hypothetical protein